MKKLNSNRWATIYIALMAYLPGIAMAQPANTPFHKEAYFVNSGFHDGLIGSSAEPLFAFREVIQVPGAPWLRLLFHAFNLGEMDSIDVNINDSTVVVNDSIRSYITITSLEDGGRQILDAISLKQWQNSSAYFNGDAIEIELYVAPQDQGIFFEIWEIMTGEWYDKTSRSLSKVSEIETLCGSDDRVPSHDDAVGRLTRVTASGDSIAWCTGWIASNGAYLTAGHCFRPGDLKVLEFNVPKSDSSGNPRFAHPDSQYAISGSSNRHDNGLGDDWAVFNVSPNSNTNLLPTQAQQAFYRMSRDENPTTIRITGYGVDDSTYNQIQQTSTGPYEEEVSDGPSDVYHKYDVDTRGGNSGSPVINDNNKLTIGIHTHGNCEDSPYYANLGTSFENDALENAIQNFPGTNVKYTDKDHPVASEDGTVFRPYDTVIEAVNAVSSGGIVSIVTNYYNETMTISKAMTITAPVGMVTIGTSGLGKSVPEAPVIAEAAASDTASSLIPTVYSLSHAYPNPFNPVTTIPFGLPEASEVSIVVYDIMGREVIRWDRQEPPGYRRLVWNGRDRSGRLVPSGLYIYRLVAVSAESDKRFTTSKKMLLLK